MAATLGLEENDLAQEGDVAHEPDSPKRGEHHDSPFDSSSIRRKCHLTKRKKTICLLVCSSRTLAMLVVGRALEEQANKLEIIHQNLHG